MWIKRQQWQELNDKVDSLARTLAQLHETQRMQSDGLTDVFGVMIAEIRTALGALGEKIDRNVDDLAVLARLAEMTKPKRGKRGGGGNAI